MNIPNTRVEPRDHFDKVNTRAPKPWTDADRAKTRTWFLVSGQHEVAKVRCDFPLANAIFDMFFETGNWRELDLYHTRRAPQNLATGGDLTDGITEFVK